LRLACARLSPGGNIEAIKLAMLIDQDPANEQPVDRATESRLFWKKAKKDLMQDIKRWEAEKHRSEKRAGPQPSDLESSSVGGTVALDPDEVA
jgi:hypothetical protein